MGENRYRASEGRSAGVAFAGSSQGSRALDPVYVNARWKAYSLFSIGFRRSGDVITWRDPRPKCHQMKGEGVLILD